MAEFAFDGWDACEPSYSQLSSYCAKLKSQVTGGTFVEFAQKVYPIVPHEGLMMQLIYFQPFQESGIPQVSIPVGNGWYLCELAQTTEGTCIVPRFGRIPGCLPKEHINSGEFILGDGVEVLFVLRFQDAGARITSLPPFPDYSPEYPLAESSYAHDVFFYLCLLADQLARLLNRGVESQGDFACGWATFMIHARAWRYVKDAMLVEVPISFVTTTWRYRHIHAGMRLVSYSNKKRVSSYDVRRLPT